MYQNILDFWFQELTPDMWWTKNDGLDELIRKRFSSFHERARQGELFTWRDTPEGCLAEIIVLDQFSRNMYRNTPKAFEFDPLALGLAQFAISKNFHHSLDKTQCSFLYLPFMHSESSLIHQIAVELFTQLGLPANLEFELKHKAIIDRFGRYPHRNAILGRQSTKEEIEFLLQPGSSF